MWDSGAMTGKYISDFSDPDLMGHPRHMVLPHLGASTGEAEENSAAMAAETIKSFLETGSIRHSVNFPSVSLPYATDAGIDARLCIVNLNKPGVLGAITTFLGVAGINIVQQINSSRGDIAYTVRTCVHAFSTRTRVDKVANRKDFGWEIAHGAVSRRPPISLYTTEARTHMYTYDAKVWDLSMFKEHFLSCQTQRYDSQPFHRCTPHQTQKKTERLCPSLAGDRHGLHPGGSRQAAEGSSVDGGDNLVALFVRPLQDGPG
jgi:hypothetical protein